MEAIAAAGNPVTVDLPAQTVTAGGKAYRFDIEPSRKTTLVQGLDAIGLSLAQLPAIEAYEAKRKAEAPWL